MLTRVLILLIILFLIDLYVFSGVRFLCRNLQPQNARMVYFIFWGITLLCFSIVIAGAMYDWSLWPKALRSYSFALVFITYFSKLFMVLFLIMDDLFRVVRWAWETVGSKLAHTDTGTVQQGNRGISRSAFLVRTGVLLASLPFTALILGMIKGKYDYQVRKVPLTLKKLPKAFKGFRIVQISDLHTGSFMDKNPIEKAVKMVNDLNPDVIFFTGDLVNDRHTEVIPFMDTLSRLKAPFGIFSILGNHDYGDYVHWDSKEQKAENLQQLIGIHKQMGWRILLDEHSHIEKDGERISVIGVQNWSARMNFARYGNLDKALDGIEYSPVNILLSHDPSHWKAEVQGKVNEIDLTLSGHTHGFQFGVEIPGFRWSPVQYVYHEWADLYSESDQFLYVNRGLGFLGYPGRVGILPEITVFDLDDSGGNQPAS